MIYLNLIPSNLWYLNLRKMLTKERWDKLSNEIRDEQSWTCQSCGINLKRLKFKKHFHCHEMWDFDDDRNIVKLVCLVCLCEYCHTATHFGYASVKGKSKLSFKQICRVNKWDYNTTNAYIEGCFEKWSQRSNKEWTFDLGSLVEWVGEENVLSIKEKLDKDNIKYVE